MCNQLVPNHTLQDTELYCQVPVSGQWGSTGKGRQLLVPQEESSRRKLQILGWNSFVACINKRANIAMCFF